MLPGLKIIFQFKSISPGLSVWTWSEKCNFEQSIRLCHFLLTIYWNQSFSSFVSQTSQPFPNAKAGNYFSFLILHLPCSSAHCLIFSPVLFSKIDNFQVFLLLWKRGWEFWSSRFIMCRKWNSFWKEGVYMLANAQLNLCSIYFKQNWAFSDSQIFIKKDLCPSATKTNNSTHFDRYKAWHVLSRLFLKWGGGSTW